MSDDESFLTRWSRRKQAGEAEPESLPEAEVEARVEAETAEAPAEPAEDQRSDDEILAGLGLPHPGELKPGDDVRGFMQAAVPARLRRLALRQLWLGNPVLANIDGLVDYGEDFTDAATVVENMQTLYQVGKGIWHEVEEPGEAGETAAQETVAGAEPTAAQVDAPGAEPEDTPAPEDGPDDPPAETAAAAAAPEEPNEPNEPNEPGITPTRRRMTFNFNR